MTISSDVDRRYLLAQAAEEERESLERSYFADPAALERVEAEEERLIEAYLANELGPAEREPFERKYLASAALRRRVDTIRRLRQAAEAAAPGVSRIGWRGVYLPLAASLLIAVMAGWWLIESRSYVQVPEVRSGTASAPPPTATPRRETSAGSMRVVALALSPISTRSAGETPAITVAPGIDAIRLDLQGDGSTAPLAHPRFVVQTVPGERVWEGDVERALDAPALAARVTIPATRLAADDYVLVLLDGGQERYRYFFRVRTP